MDLVYVPDVFSYTRNPQYYRDYEEPWNQDYFRSSGYKKSAERQRPTQPTSEKNCYFCQETKRRNLAIYIRSKSRSDSTHEGIHEEDEENDVVEHTEKKPADANQVKTKNKSAKSPRESATGKQKS